MTYISGLQKPSFPLQGQPQGQGRNAIPSARTGNDSFSQSRQRNAWYISPWQIAGGVNINCQWEPLRTQILQQWSRLSLREVESAGPNRGRLALLIYNKYGISPQLIENYLRNFERVMPVA